MEPARRILTVLDRHLSGPADIRLLGGAALILGYGRGRSTEDVDLVPADFAEVWRGNRACVEALLR